jgi:hypothetical protein
VRPKTAPSLSKRLNLRIRFACTIFPTTRPESGFEQRDKSSAKAVGLMQATPEAGRDTAKRFGVAYDWNRLVSDPVYNTQIGAAEVAALLKEYGGSHVMPCAGYNAGRGRVEEWVAKHGDPRDPKVGSSAFRSPRRATMCSARWRISRFGPVSAPAGANLLRAAPVGWQANPIGLFLKLSSR